jgi:hypothetical protein
VRMINDKDLSEQRLTDIPDLDANNAKMQKVMYATHARAEQMQLERDSALHRAKDMEERSARPCTSSSQRIVCRPNG